MKVALFDTHRFDRQAFEEANRGFGHELHYFEPRLDASTAQLASGFDAVCAFVNDRLDQPTLATLASEGVRFVALRSAGYNHVDLAAAQKLGIRVARVPAYSPHAVAEHAVAMLLAHNRKLCRAHSRIQDLNFSLDGLVGFDLHGKTVGVIGTGKIGAVFAKIMLGFGCQVLAHDTRPDASLVQAGAVYTGLDDLYARSHVISLHVPLTPQTRYLIDERAFEKMRPGAVLLNTGRGGLVRTQSLIDALKAGRIGGACLDVYEEEENVFFKDLSEGVLADDVLARLLTFPNVLITSHQAFLTREALHNIASTTLENLAGFERGKASPNELRP